MTADAHYQLVKNAVEGGMNTLRVWGGGMFLPAVWCVRALSFARDERWFQPNVLSPFTRGSAGRSYGTTNFCDFSWPEAQYVRREDLRREDVRRENVRRENVRREDVRKEDVRREDVRREDGRRDDGL
jgi:hypothetical protein